MSEHPDAVLARASLHMPVAARGGAVAGVIFHSDRGSTDTAELFVTACTGLNVTRSMGRVGSALDNAGAGSLFSTLEFECLRKDHFATRDQARCTAARWIDDWYSQADAIAPAASARLSTSSSSTPDPPSSAAGLPRNRPTRCP
jgi:transposase InsO family protein